MNARKIYEIIDTAKEEERESIALNAIEKYPCYINEVRDAINAHKSVTGNNYFIISKVFERNKSLLDMLDRFKKNKFIVLKSTDTSSGFVFRKQKNKILKFDFDSDGFKEKEEYDNLNEAKLWDKYVSKDFHIPEPSEEREIVFKAVASTRESIQPSLVEV